MVESTLPEELRKVSGSIAFYSSPSHNIHLVSCTSPIYSVSAAFSRDNLHPWVVARLHDAKIWKPACRCDFPFRRRYSNLPSLSIVHYDMRHIQHVLSHPLDDKKTRAQNYSCLPAEKHIQEVGRFLFF